MAGADEIRNDLIRCKVTCPFLGSAVNEGFLAIEGDAGNPLAKIDDVRALGNSGGGDLGIVLGFFAAGNHAFMRGPSGRLDRPVPDGRFSLELPGSQGSHPGHSGILQGNPELLASGRLDEAAFERLAKRATNGLVKRSDVARFIAENLKLDPKSKVAGAKVIELLASDAESAFVSALRLVPENTNPTQRAFTDKAAKLIGEDNLLGSSGEFGLLFAFLANKPGAGMIDGEPALSLQDLRGMFINKHLPDGWMDWKKLASDWLKHTGSLAQEAIREYRRIQDAGAFRG